MSAKRNNSNNGDIGLWGDTAQKPCETHPLFSEEEADLWAAEMHAMIESDKSENVQRMIKSNIGQEIERWGWYQRIELQKFGISTTSNHSKVIESPGSLNRLGDRLTPMEATLVRPIPKWKYIEPILPEVRGKSVLEIGCANGFFAKKFAQLGAERVTGVDLIANQIEAARWAANILDLDQIVYLNTDVLIDQNIKPHDIVFLSEVQNHFPLPFLGFLRIANLAREFIVLDSSGILTGNRNNLWYMVIGNSERQEINYIHCNLSENLMIQFLNVIGIDNEMIKAYVSPIVNTHVLYLIDVRNMRARRAEIRYPEYLKMVFENF